MRPDYCPMANEPCQCMCEVPCGSSPKADKVATETEGGNLLVPREPTSEMLYAMAEQDGWHRTDRDHPGLSRWADYWYVAIAAAPEMSPVNVTRNICPTCESLARAVMLDQFSDDGRCGWEPPSDQQAQDAVDTLTEEGWIWDGDKWLRPVKNA